MRTELLQLSDKPQVFSSGTGIFLDNFNIHLLVSTYTKESMITKDEVFDRHVMTLCTIVGVRPYTAIIEK